MKIGGISTLINIQNNIYLSFYKILGSYTEMLEHPNISILVQRSNLHKLTYSACTSLDLKVKQKAITNLGELILNETITPEYLYEIIMDDTASINEWEITCFVLMEILHDNVDRLIKNKILPYFQCLAKVLKEFYQMPNVYMRNKLQSNGNMQNNPDNSNHISKQIIKPFVKYSFKRTLGELMKYLLLNKVPISQYFWLSKLIPEQNKANKSGPATLTAKQKQELYFCLEVALCFIEAIAESDTAIDFMDQIKINYNFQSLVIGQLLRILPTIMYNMDTQIQMYQLIDRMEVGLSIKPKSQEHIGSGHEQYQRISKLSQIELPLSLLQALLYFPYNTRKQAIKPNDNICTQIWSGSKESSTIEYPKQVALLIGSKQFIEVLFTVANKFLEYICKEVGQTINDNVNNSSSSRLGRNVKLEQYLKYYKTIMKQLGQISKTKLHQTYINMFSQNVRISRNGIVEQNIMNIRLGQGPSVYGDVDLDGKNRAQQYYTYQAYDNEYGGNRSSNTVDYNEVFINTIMNNVMHIYNTNIVALNQCILQYTNTNINTNTNTNINTNINTHTHTHTHNHTLTHTHTHTHINSKNTLFQNMQACKQILLSLSQSISCIINKLVNNVEIAAVLTQEHTPAHTSTPSTREPMTAVGKYRQLLNTMHTITLWNISYINGAHFANHNNTHDYSNNQDNYSKYKGGLTVSNFYHTINEEHQEYEQEIDYGNTNALRELFKFWQLVVHEKQEIKIRLAYRNMGDINMQANINTIIDILADNSNIDALLTDNVMEEGNDRGDRGEGEQVELIYTILMQITMHMLNKLSTQDVCILSTPGSRTAPASTTSNATQRYTQLNGQLAEIFKIASTLIQSELSTKKHTLAILTAIGTTLGELINQRDAIGRQLLEHIQQNSQNMDIYDTFMVVQSRISNVVVMCRSIFSDIVKLTYISKAAYTQKENSNTQTSADEPEINAQIYNQYTTIKANIINYMQAYTYLHTMPQLHSYQLHYSGVYSSIDYIMLLFKYTQVMQDIEAVRYGQNRNRQGMQAIVEREAKDGADYDKLMTWLEERSIVGDTNTNTINQGVRMYQDMVIKKYLRSVSTCINHKNINKGQYKAYIQLILQILKMLSKIAQAYKQAQQEHANIVNQYYNHINAMSNTKYYSYRNTRHNMLPPNKKVQIYLSDTCWQVLNHLKAIYDSLNNTDDLQMNPNGITQQIKNVEQNIVELLCFMLLQDSNYSTSRIDHQEIQDHFATILSLLNIQNFTEYNTYLKDNLHDSTRMFEIQSKLEYDMSILIGIFQCFAKNNIDQTPVPTLFLNFLDKQMGVFCIMQSYLYLIETTHSKRITKINKLLRFNKMVLESICQINGTTKAAIKVKYNYIIACLPFWGSLLDYIFNLYTYNNSDGEGIYERYLNDCQQVLINIYQIFKSLIARNLKCMDSNINFYLLKKQAGQSFDTFITNIMKTYVRMFKVKSADHQQKQPREMEVIYNYKQLYKAVNSSFTATSRILLQFIFEHNTQITLISSMKSNAPNILAAQFTEMFMIKARQFIIHASSTNQNVGDKSSGNRKTGKSIIKNMEEKLIKLSPQRLGELQQNLAIIRIVFTYISRATLYEHNKDLQANINNFLMSLNKTKLGLDSKVKSSALSQQKRYSPQSDLSLQFLLFFELVKLGITTIVKFKYQTSCLQQICFIMTCLPSIFKHYTAITPHRDKNIDYWSIQAKKIMEDIIAIQPLLIQQFFNIWQFCANNQKENYQTEKQQYSQWFKSHLFDGEDESNIDYDYFNDANVNQLTSSCKNIFPFMERYW